MPDCLKEDFLWLTVLNYIVSDTNDMIHQNVETVFDP